ncbi:Uncharacterised protein [Streptococcus pyogenes]|nr:Uncharacterised protein [Streptococcus pyogenes]
MSASSTATFTAPAGWEVLKAVETTGTRRNQTWGRVKQLGDGATATFATSVLNAMTFGVVWGTGDWSNRVVGATRARGTVGASPRTQNIAPSVTAAAGSVVVAITQEATSAQVASDEITGTSPAGWTRARWIEQIPNYLETIGIYQKAMPTAGATGDLTVTYSSTQDSNGWAVQIAIPGTAPASPLPGFSSVSQMLASPGATWAHRGGSMNWPEMSEYAYDQAVLAGYGALEFSAQRTNDGGGSGTWIGSHDPTPSRTSQTTGAPAYSAMSYATLLATYQNSLNAAGTPRPYYRLVDFLEKFTPTHVVVVDPKDELARVTEFLNLLDAHGGNTKIVVKFYGAGSGAAALADAAAAKGYQTWGYFYEADIASGELAAWQSHWSILGMEYSASQGAWDTILAYGKPVVGHIAGSQANFDTAIAKGARMVQSANVSGIRAVGAVRGVVQTMPALASASAGAATPPAFSGSVVSTLPPLTSSVAGAVGASVSAGTVITSLPPLTQAVSGSAVAPAVAGAVAASLPPLTATAEGSAIAPMSLGAIVVVLPALTASATGAAVDPNVVIGDIHASLPSLTSAAAGITGPRTTRMVLTPTIHRPSAPLMRPRPLSPPAWPPA